MERKRADCNRRKEYMNFLPADCSVKKLTLEKKLNEVDEEKQRRWEQRKSMCINYFYHLMNIEERNINKRWTCVDRMEESQEEIRTKGNYYYIEHCGLSKRRMRGPDAIGAILSRFLLLHHSLLRATNEVRSFPVSVSSRSRWRNFVKLPPWKSLQHRRKIFKRLCSWGLKGRTSVNQTLSKAKKGR